MRVLGGISGRLLVLTVIVVMLVEVVIFVPSVSRFRVDYLQERVVRAEIAALSVMAAPDGQTPPTLGRKLLDSAGVLNVVVASEGVRMLAVPGEPITRMVATVDLRDAGVAGLIRDALATLFGAHRGEVLRVVGQTERGVYDLVEITLPADPLRREMLDYGLRILKLSLLISIASAALVFLLVRRFVVAPILRVIRNVEAFQQNPEDPDRVIRPSSRVGEVADAERALAAMQQDVLAALRERGRLASLGEAVAKISHDLRNMLAAGRLVTERLEVSRDPLVARVLPKLVGSIDRAVALCQRTLDYGRAEEAVPEPRLVDLNALLDEVVEGLGLGAAGEAATGETVQATGPTLVAERLPEGGPARLVPVRSGRAAPPEGPRLLAGGQVRIVSELPPGAVVTADPDQLYRILSNLVRNAVEAIRSSGRPGDVRLGLERGPGTVSIIVADNGPGMPAKALENLFRPFRGGTRRSGTGLGLAIAADLARAHGGRVELVGTSTLGTTFKVMLPAQSRTESPAHPALPGSSARR